MNINLPYGKSSLMMEIDKRQVKGIMESGLHAYVPLADGETLVENALLHPVCSKPLADLARGKHEVVLIASDHTRPVPSRIIVPRMLREIRRGNPHVHVTILIATGCHRGMTEQELELKFGKEIVETEDIVMHDCTDQSNMVHIGTLPSGGECLVNGLAQKADLLVAEGFIEPHFFAGYSGGRKSVLPGIASRKTVLANHCSEFIADDHARTGILDENPIHKDMVWAARQAGLSFIVNVVLDAEKHIVFATAGDTIAAHEAGCHFLDGLSRVNPIPADIVVSTNGGYPLDQNVYQAVKGMTAAEATVREGGVIIMVAKADDGIGGEAFFHQMADEPDIEKTRCLFLSRNKNETVPDQWQSQVFIRVLQKATVIFISSINDTIVRDLHMIPAHDIGEALCLAAKIIGNSTPSVTIIPDGVSIIVDKVF